MSQQQDVPVDELPSALRDVSTELKTSFPKATYSSGYRTKEYQEDMRRRGYNPAKDSDHLDGDGLDISDFGDLSLSQGAAALRRKYPDAKILFGDKGHKDHVHFSLPGYGEFQAYGGAKKAGISNPLIPSAKAATLNDTETVDAVPIDMLPEEIVSSQSEAGLSQEQVISSLDKLMLDKSKTTEDVIQYLKDSGLTPTAEQVAGYKYWKDRPELTPPGAILEEPNLEETEEQGILESAAEDFGLGSRGILEGAGSLVDAIAGPLNALVNAAPGEQGLSTTPFKDLASELSNYLGLKVPETDAEKIAFAINEGGIQGLLTFGTGAALAGAKGTTGVVGKAIASAPATEVTASAASTTAAEIAEQEGFGTFGQLAAGFIAGGITANTALRLEKALISGNKVPPVVADEVVTRMTDALNSRQKLADSQKRLNTKERQERLKKLQQLQRASKGTKEDFYKEKAVLEGEFKKVEFEPIEQKFTQEEIDSLFKSVRDSDELFGFETIAARQGLLKLLEGEVPVTSEIALLSKVFPKDFISAVRTKRSNLTKAGEVLVEGVSLPRAIMSSYDLSAPFRQGMGLVHKKEFWKNLGPMVKAGLNEKYFDGMIKEIKSRPTYSLMEDYKLAITDMGQDLSKREEDFMSSWATKIPGINASNRAYSGFLNKLRADVFDSLLESSKKAGSDLTQDPKKMEKLTSFINAASGRGNLGSGEIGQKLNAASPLLTAGLFSPRLIASRLHMLDPTHYVRTAPELRKEYLKSHLAMGAFYSTVAGLASSSGLVDIETDPRSSDFLKLRNGETRWDILGGFGPYMTLAARLQTEQTKSIGGNVYDLESGFGKRTKADVIGRFVRNKESPVASYLHDYFAGENVIGEEFSPVGSAVDRMVPMFIQDLADLSEKDGIAGAAKVSPAFIGVGVQDFREDEETEEVPLEALPANEEAEQIAPSPEEVPLDLLPEGL